MLQITLGLLFLGVVILLVAPAAQAQWPTSLLTEDTLSVVAMGQATGAPDRAQVTVELTAPAPTLLEGFQQINDQIEVVRGALEKAEVPADAVTVRGPTFITPPAFGPLGVPGLAGGAPLEFQPPVPQPGGGPQRQAKASVTATLPFSQQDLEGSLKRVDQVLQSLAEAGQASPQMAFALSNPAMLEEALVKDAIGKAQAQAQALGAALGGKVGKVMSAQSVDMAQMMEASMKGVFAGMGPLMQMVGAVLGGGNPANPREVTVTRMVIVNFRFERL